MFTQRLLEDVAGDEKLSTTMPGCSLAGLRMFRDELAAMRTEVEAFLAEAETYL